MSQTLFRVHTTAGHSIDVRAENPAQARGVALIKIPGAIISKVKVVKEKADA